MAWRKRGNQNRKPSQENKEARYYGLNPDSTVLLSKTAIGVDKDVPAVKIQSFLPRNFIDDENKDDCSLIHSTKYVVIPQYHVEDLIKALHKVKAPKESLEGILPILFQF